MLTAWSSLGILLLLFGIVGCDAAPATDPGPPFAFGADVNHALSSIEVLTCPNERVLEITISRDIGNDGIAKPGMVLWELVASGASTANVFELATAQPGFQVAVAASAPISGNIVVHVTTTSISDQVPLSTSYLRTDGMSFGGRRQQRLTPEREKQVLQRRCR